MTVAARRKLLVLFFSAMMLPSILMAAMPPDSTNALVDLEPSWGQFLKVMFMLVLVVVLIWVSLALLKKAMGGRAGSAHNIELLGGIPLGTRKSIQFIMVGESLHVVGVTDHHISLLSVIKDPDEIASIISVPEGGQSPASFTSLLKRFSGGQGGDNGA